jgi:hypothetical protein
VSFGCLADVGIPGPVVAMAASRRVLGYWLATAHGQIRAFGDAHFLGTVPPGVIVPPLVALSPAASA